MRRRGKPDKGWALVKVCGGVATRPWVRREEGDPKSWSLIVELNNRRCELSHDKKIKIKIERYKEEGRETSLKSEANRE